MKNSKIFLLALILVAIGVIGLFWTTNSSILRVRNKAHDFMSQQGMMSGRNHQQLTKGAVQSLQKQNTNGVINNKSKTITFNQTNINLAVLAAPPTHPGDYFEINNLINPTLILKKDSNINLTLINEDNIMHGLEVVSTKPPFVSRPMMSYRPVFNSFIMPLPGTSGQNYAYSKKTIIFSKVGTYYYICPVPNHAKMGMYGKIIVQ